MGYKELVSSYTDKRILLWSAFLAYLSVLNMAPFMYFLILTATHIPFVHLKLNDMSKFLSEIMPKYSGAFDRYIHMFLSNTKNMELINTLILLAAAFSLAKAFLSCVDDIWGVEKRKNIVKEGIRVLISMFIFSLAISLTLVFSIVLPIFLPNIAYKLYQTFLPFLLWFTITTILFRISIRKSIKTKYLIVSSFTTTAMVFILKGMLAIYFKFFIYNKIYGSLSIVPTLLLWLFLFWNVILLGIAVAKLLSERTT